MFLSKMLHGGDYNPEQWLKYPEILEQDIEIMKKAKINCVSLGIFSWSSLEPQEGEFTFEWLDEVIENLYKNEIYTILATPSGSKPIWMSLKYPEILRVDSNRIRNLPGGRHNHCYTSPIYRKKAKIINTKLAERYGKNPAVILWHISNELQGECHCDLCQSKFRKWLKAKYKTIENLNDQWWTTFWSHKFNDFNEIESPANHGELGMDGLTLDWKRFCTEQTVDFYKKEIEPIKKVNLSIPVTTNFMTFYDGINYNKFKEHIDIASWDSYPSWHNGNGDETINAVYNAFYHDYVRALKKSPFLLMECTPSSTNWTWVSKHKKPKMHKLAAIQAIAHGANSIQYFQIRQSRGCAEKFHSAVISHNHTEENRIYNQVAEVGNILEKISQISSATIKPQVAIIYDVENKWALDISKGPRNAGNGYEDLLFKNYKAFWSNNIPVDVIDMDEEIKDYKLVIAPMAYMLKKGFSSKIKSFVAAGGTIVSSYLSGVVNENSLCFMGELPAEELSDILGIYTEDIEGLYDEQKNSIVMIGEYMGLKGDYESSKICEIIHTKTAEILGVYGSDFYKDEPVFTVNSYKNGYAYYIGTSANQEFFNTFYKNICTELDVEKNINVETPDGVTIGKRSYKEIDYYFIQNFTNETVSITLPYKLINILNDEVFEYELNLEPYDSYICTKWLKLEEL